MLSEKEILEQFRMKVCEKIYLSQKGINRFVVKTPFLFEDGDNLVIILKYDKERKKWVLTDEGHTFIHLSYFMDDRDFSQGTRKNIIDDSKKMFDIEETKEGLFITIENDNFGDSLYNFIQCLLKISDVTYLDRERVKSTFEIDNHIKSSKKREVR